jgi:hypothetical protein
VRGVREEGVVEVRVPSGARSWRQPGAWCFPRWSTLLANS